MPNIWGYWVLFTVVRPRRLSSWPSRVCRHGEMTEMLALPDQDRKEAWRFRRYSDGFAMDF